MVRPAILARERAADAREWDRRGPARRRRLVHDVSKLAEFDGQGSTPTGALFGHPYHGVHLVAAAGLPVELAHVVLSHTSRTTVEPAFLEAEPVRRAHEAATNAI
jgi:hypothetical protein